MTDSRFVADGFERARKGIHAEVRAEVEQKYAEQWNAAGFFERRVLRGKIDWEVKKRMKDRADQAPPDALY